MVTESQIDSAVKSLFANIEFTKEPSGLYDPLRYMIEIGGKRIRPRLCILAYSLFKDELSDEILEPAAALEVFHSFTLIHDDIMDKSPLRRGKATVWTKWNDDTAILSGDVMCIDSYRRMAMAPKAVLDRVLALFSRTAAEVCEGQQYDMDFESVEAVPMEDYIKMIGLKTGVLIACAAKVGAIIGGASEKDCDLIYKYGYDLGLAFQIADDWLDAYGDEKVFGKPIGGDIVLNKKCWLTTHAQELLKGDAAGAAELSAAMAMPVATAAEKAAKVAAVKAIYDRLGVGNDARKEIERLTENALKSAQRLGLSKVKYEMLARYANSLVGRTK